ncbi:MAG: energy-coupling factor ABC transporter permease [Victivallaceae bacterium]|nr:energy-coupling factor ABC transporter permease [Victivallaceae bacterium]
MHVPNDLLNSLVPWISLVFSVFAAQVSVKYLLQEKISASGVVRFLVISCVIFALQAFPFPLGMHVSGHLLGGVFAAAMLGIPGGILSMALVLMVQAFCFGEGGTVMLGLNTFNIAVLGVGVGGAIRDQLMRKLKFNDYIASGAAAFFSVMLSAGMLSMEMALEKYFRAASIMSVMLGCSFIEALVESVATAALLWIFNSRFPFHADNRNKLRRICVAGTLLVLLALCWLPHASRLPSPLEYTIERFHFYF